MGKKLIIVESPSKARTLSKFLGSSFIVKASMGHVRDLPKSKIGVDIEHGFTPQYQVIKGREKSIEELRQAAKQAEETYLASDPDREGEAIAWHLAEALKLKNPVRIVFHEITRGAVEEAMEHPRSIDRSLVAAQEARRVIDRLLGYKLSPFLWKKVRAGLSAGRVQSVAVRLVADREAEIEAFVPVESWSLEVVLEHADGHTFTARLSEIDGQAAHKKKGKTEEQDEKEGEERVLVHSEEEAAALLEKLGYAKDGFPLDGPGHWNVTKVTTANQSRSAPLPYTTSVLQQDASTRLRFSPKRTMLLAQQLYEGVDLGDQGPVGLITYMRTDSTRLSDEAVGMAQGYISSTYGERYVRTTKPVQRGKSALHVQDAHEAIRPTDVARTPDKMKEVLDPSQFRLYELIWKRFVASQMAEAKIRSTRVVLERAGCLFRASGSVVEFDGFQRIWRRDEGTDREEKILPALSEGESLPGLRIDAEQHFSQPPPRYTEASLIKDMEEKGIGRPSTYAPTLDVIQQRRYVVQKERKLYLTALGKTVDLVLRENIPSVVDVAFTAELEGQLDKIEEGISEYEPIVAGWYGPFEKTVETMNESVQRVKIPVKETGEECPKCHEGQLVIREGRYGEFVGCSRYPECDYVRNERGSTAEPTGENCPLCGKPLVTRVGRRGPFVGCSGYPSCRYVAPTAQEGESAPPPDLGPCPDCGSPLVIRRGRRGAFIGCSAYPKCRHTAPLEPNSAAAASAAASAGPAVEPTGETCPDCGKPLVTRQGRFGPFISCSGYPTCKYRPPKAAKQSGSADDGE